MKPFWPSLQHETLQPCKGWKHRVKHFPPSQVSHVCFSNSRAVSLQFDRRPTRTISVLRLLLSERRAKYSKCLPSTSYSKCNSLEKSCRENVREKSTNILYLHQSFVLSVSKSQIISRWGILFLGFKFGRSFSILGKEFGENLVM